MAALAGNRVLELTMQTFGQIVSHHLATVDDREIREMLAADHGAAAQSPPVTRSRPAS